MQGENDGLRMIREWVRDNQPGPDESGNTSVKVHPRAPVVITGLSGYFPGCMDVAELWNSIDADRSLITEPPAQRFSSETRTSIPARWGGFIPDIASFDPDSFSMLPMEANEMDPRLRLLLMSTWRTLEDACIDPQILTRSNTGVFIACEANEYALLMHRQGFVPRMGFAQSDSMIANRISYQFDFAGPSEMVNATCAGFAVALHRAFVSLRMGLIDRAVVGAANTILLPEPFNVLADAEQLTKHNTVKSFGSGGDGFLRAEGVGTILLERQQVVDAEQRPYYASIKHAAVNFNGQGGVSMASPNIDAHAELIKTCYREAHIDPRQLSYIEAQGMGLPVADIAEWTAFNRALKELCDEQGLSAEPGFCRVSTLKPMLGHMHSASSLGALLKIIRSFQTNRIHRILDYSKPNEYCDMDSTPCRIVSETEDWAESDIPRLAALHSYGSGGNNAHILLEEASNNRRITADHEAHITRYPFNLRPCWFTQLNDPVELSSADQYDSVLQVICNNLGKDRQTLDRDKPFQELGLDSLAVAPFVSKLAEDFNVKLRRSDIFSYPTPNEMARHILSRINESTQMPSAGGAPKRTDNAVDSDDIAIIGINLSVAGANNHAEFWDLLSQGLSGIIEVPEGRFEEAITDLKSAKGGFLDDVDAFDPMFFRISPKEAEGMDPRHRLLLQSAWSAIEDAGYNPEDWKGANHGIFIGIEESDYPTDQQSTITSVHAGTAPARIGYILDTKGPVLAISTACSSSLVAVHYACRSILEGESACALAGGCNVISQPARTLYALSRMGNMLSPDGTCYAFDQRANGMVIGEGVGVVVLKRLSQALADGDSVYGVIKGSGINYDGKTNGLTAPSGARQRELYETVYRRSGVSPEQISYVVCHGTGTSLGDPVECNALIDAFTPATGEKQFCALTSPKTNVGHTQAASGIVNLITAALALRHQQIPPSLNYERHNEDIHFDDSPFYVNTTLKTWDDAERYVAVSSFGHTGTNAHLLLSNAAEHGIENRACLSNEPELILLSAKNDKHLRETAANLLNHALFNLNDLTYTLQVGRQAMEERLALIVGSLDELREKLTAYLQGEPGIAGLYRGSSSPQQEPESLVQPNDAQDVINVWLQQEKLGELAGAWIKGVPIDWGKLHRTARPRRISLPTYPFEKERYWLRQQRQSTDPLPGSDDAQAESDQLYGPQVEEAFELSTFEEVWALSPIQGDDPRKINTLVCVLPGPNGQQSIIDKIEHESPTTRLIFITQDQLNTGERSLSRIQDLHGQIDALVYVSPIKDDQGMKNPVDLFNLFRGIAKAQILRGRLLLVNSYLNELQRCHVDSWIGFERSLSVLIPQVKMAVMGMQVENQSEEEFINTSLGNIWEELTAKNLQHSLHENGDRLTLSIRPTKFSTAESALKTGGTYLITGGCGGLGFHFAEHLAKTYSANLILSGRSALDGEQQTCIKQLQKQGSQVIYLQADICDALKMKTGLQQAKKQTGPIDGVIHAAGIEDSETIFNKDLEVFNRILDPKVKGTLVLDEVLCDEPLDFIAYFSSSAAILGDFGACDYAVGNRFEMAYAHYRNRLRHKGQRKGKAVVFNWPLWKEGGMGAVSSDQTQFYLRTSGQRALATKTGIELFTQLLNQNTAQHLVLYGKTGQLYRSLGLTDWTQPIPKQPVTKQPDDITGRRSAMKGFSLEECILWDLKQGVSELLKIRRNRLKLETNLADYGFDSISLAEFAEFLTAHFGIEVSPSIFFGHSTLKHLGNYFLEQHRAVMEQFYAHGDEPVNDVGVKPTFSPEYQLQADKERQIPTNKEYPVDEPIAIIGMSGRFPDARTVEAMWEILSAGRNAVAEVPADRFDWRDYFGDPSSDKTKTNGKWLGSIPGVAEFDPLFFEISPREAEAMDPRQRLLLQELWKALEDAGYGPSQLKCHQVGTFVGVEEGDYGFVAAEGEITSNHSGIMASRLAYFLDLHGPAMAINTACSSGLVAAHQACMSLRNDECDTALVAGVSLQLTAAGHVAMGQSGMLSSDGKSYAFDKRANGMVPGEAVVAVVLKRLSLAEAEGDPIHAIIRASGINYDGKTNGITAPSGVAQTALLKGIYQRSGINPESMGYIVTHGTGTKLGDPVEINALNDVFKASTSARQFCALTSTKTNFGHSFAASGLLNMVCLIKAFQYHEIPASLHCENENDYIAWEESPFYVSKSRQAWTKPTHSSRRGGVSAFGMSGTNAHMILEEYVPESSSHILNPANARPYTLLVLSAKTEEALHEQVVGMIQAFKRDDVRKAGLDNISLTLLVGRHQFHHRLAIVVQDFDDAILTWSDLGNGEKRPNLFGGKVPDEFSGQRIIRQYAQELIRQCQSSPADARSYQESLYALADLYCQGYDLSFQSMFGTQTLHRVSLPTYPFARENYWVTKAKPTGSGNAVTQDQTPIPTKWLHPLLHQNTSTLSEQRFSSTFRGDEFFLSDHLLRGEKVLPGVTYLEMARAALELSSDSFDSDGHVALNNVQWIRPWNISDHAKDIHIRLFENDDRIEFDVYSWSEQDDREITIFCKGMASYFEAGSRPLLDINDLRRQISSTGPSPAQCYAIFKSAGVDYGTSYQGLRALYLGDGQVLAQLAVPDHRRDSRDQYVLHPSLMDAAFQATLGLSLSAEAEAATRIPFALEQLQCYGQYPDDLWAWVRPSEGSSTDHKIQKLDIDLCDETGRVWVRMLGFSTRTLSPENTAEPALQRTYNLTGDEFFLKDHGGLLPGVVSLEWALDVANRVSDRKVQGLRQVVWSQTVCVTDGPHKVQISLYPSAEGFSYRVKDGDKLHAQGHIVVEEAVVHEKEMLPLNEIQSLCTQQMQQQDYHDLLKTELGPAFQGIIDFRHNHKEALTTLKLPACVKSDFEKHLLHPSLLNGAIQSANILSMMDHPGGDPPVPFSLDQLWVHRQIPELAYAYVKRSPEPSSTPDNARLNRYDIRLCDRHGEVVVSINGYTSISTQAMADSQLVYAVSQWEKPALNRDKRLSSQESVRPVFILGDKNVWLQKALSDQWPKARVVVLNRLEGDRATIVEAQFNQVLNLIQKLIKEKIAVDQPVLLLLSDRSQPSFQAAYAGLFRTASLEYPRLIGKVIRYSPAKTDWIKTMVDLIKLEVSHASSDVEIRYNEAGERELKTLRQVYLHANTKSTPINQGDVIWITGGLGGLGRIFAHHYGKHRHARLILSGRSPLSESKQQFLDVLRQEGIQVSYLQGDIANRDDAKAMVNKILETAGRLNGIIHAAGVVDDAYVLKKTPEQVHRVLQPKIAGVLALDEATKGVTLDYMILFSSLTGTFGNPGQADYAGANAFLDGFSEERNRQVKEGTRHGRTLSLAWPLWRDGGMRMDEQSERLLQQSFGMLPMDSASGIVAMDLALQYPYSHLIVVQGKQQIIQRKLFPVERQSHNRNNKESPIQAQVGNPSELPMDQVTELLVGMVAEQQKIQPEKITLNVELSKYGFNSIGFTELANRLNQALGLDLMPTLFFERSTLKSLAGYLLEHFPKALQNKFANKAVPASSADPQRITRKVGRRFSRSSRQQGNTLATGRQAIAIVGISGRFPGCADVNEYWEHLDANHDLITDVPPDRWCWQDYYGDPLEQPGKTRVKSAGFIDGVDQFDPAFFEISPREAIALDPQFRLLLQTAWATVEDAGYRAGDFSGTKTGVYVGVSTSDYKDAWLQQAGSNPGLEGPSLVSHFVIANRISYALDLRGPSESIDTACSSSLIAVHRAIEGIRQGSCECALVGGVNVIGSPGITIAASRAGMLSEDGRCKTFDSSADGYGRGEGVGAILIKPLERAITDKDHIYGLIRGSAENHGGKANSPTAPNPVAQQELLVTAYTKAAIDPRTVAYIETHGTGTELGDPIEVNGLKSAFDELYARQGCQVSEQHCGLGSVKTNVGHLEAAAGIAGLLKLVMMLKHKRIPGNIHLKEPNPYLKLEASPFYLAQETRDWIPILDKHNKPLPRRAGLSSFGIGGSNAHLIVEEYLADCRQLAESDRVTQALPIVLSAKKSDRLMEQAKNLRAFVRRSDVSQSMNLRDLAYTLQVGRESMEDRLGFTASSLAEVVEKLNAYVEGEAGRDDLYQARVKRRSKTTARFNEVAPEQITDWIQAGSYTRLLDAWVQGADIDWTPLWLDNPPGRISLPTYPFNKGRYWFKKAKVDTAVAETEASAADSLVAAREQDPGIVERSSDIELSLLSAERLSNSDGSEKEHRQIALQTLHETAAPVGEQPNISAGSVESLASIEHELIHTLAGILYMDEGDITFDRSFSDLGLDSVIGVEWVHLINKKYGLKLPATRVYDYANIQVFSEYLHSKINRHSDVTTGGEASLPSALSLDEVLELVQQKKLDVEAAQQLIGELDLQQGYSG